MLKPHSIRRRNLGALALAGMLLPVAGRAQAWPTKPIRIVVPFAPGGGTDVVARILAEQLTQKLGQTVLVENRTGANGNLAASFVAKSEPDGYTLLFPNTSIMTIAPSIYTNLTFDPLRDFQPIIRIGEVPALIVVNPQVPAHTVKELVALAAVRPGEMALASGGSGSVSHLTGEMFKLAAKIKMLHVPYKGNAPQIADIVSNQVPAGVADLSGCLPMIRSGKLRALAITTKARSPFLPDVPTLGESGLLTYEASVWLGLVAPAATPMPIVQKLDKAIKDILADKAVADRIQDLGFVVLGGGTPADFAQRIAEETKHWKEIVVTSGATVE